MTFYWDPVVSSVTFSLIALEFDLYDLKLQRLVSKLQKSPRKKNLLMVKKLRLPWLQKKSPSNNLIVSEILRPRNLHLLRLKKLWTRWTRSWPNISKKMCFYICSEFSNVLNVQKFLQCFLNLKKMWNLAWEIGVYSRGMADHAKY